METNQTKSKRNRKPKKVAVPVVDKTEVVAPVEYTFDYVDEEVTSEDNIVYTPIQENPTTILPLSVNQETVDSLDNVSVEIITKELSESKKSFMQKLYNIFSSLGKSKNK